MVGCECTSVLDIFLASMKRQMQSFSLVLFWRLFIKDWSVNHAKYLVPYGVATYTSALCTFWCNKVSSESAILGNFSRIRFLASASRTTMEDKTWTDTFLLCICLLLFLSIRKEKRNRRKNKKDSKRSNRRHQQTIFLGKTVKKFTVIMVRAHLLGL